ncbi:hypothetical protein Sango_1687300 [Sesamum angolense]|uniref:Gag1-like clamp domain-containing protein n=1 Tax=Sesamum angolense TaxID=2727404 RepID=A0AAE2BRY3_9LAMI|nr:hypothetical protein Sango_1687300 [Sesamum angolense]
MDYNKVQSCEIISSTNKRPQMHATHGAGSSMKPTEFINHELQHPVDTISCIYFIFEVLRCFHVFFSGTRADRNGLGKERLKYCLRSYRTYDSLLSSNRRFPRPIPLGEMVGYLVETWACRNV